MDAFVDWYNEVTERGTERKALSVSGAAHLYFECIHPFEDGNGRIGRLLAEKALARCLGRPSMIPLSTTIHARRPDYYRALDTCRHSLDAVRRVLRVVGRWLYAGCSARNPGLSSASPSRREVVPAARARLSRSGQRAVTRSRAAS